MSGFFAARLRRPDQTVVLAVVGPNLSACYFCGKSRIHFTLPDENDLERLPYVTGRMAFACRFNDDMDLLQVVVEDHERMFAARLYMPDRPEALVVARKQQTDGAVTVWCVDLGRWTTSVLPDERYLERLRFVDDDMIRLCYEERTTAPLDAVFLSHREAERAKALASAEEDSRRFRRHARLMVAFASVRERHSRFFDMHQDIVTLITEFTAN